ncbi:MAG: NHL repeat-containing protein, partial [Candidatus Aminicenantes bacterium]|nr:NHL repeat-containing protein [Candidatus Aminicenantes bacterium]
MKRYVCLLLVSLLVSGMSAGLSADEGRILWSFSTFGEGGSDYFYQPSDIEIDRGLSLIHVIDSANHRIVTFDENGALVRIIGREGQGPGDLFRPTGAFVCEDSSLAVADYGNNRIQFFDKNGEFLRTIICPTGMVADLYILKKRIYTIPTYGTSGFRIRPDDREEFQPLLMVLDEKGDLVRLWTIRDFPEKQPFIRALIHRVCMAVSQN